MKQVQINMNKNLILVSEKDKEIGKAKWLECHRLPGLLHRAFMVMVFDSKDNLLLARRSKYKPLWPGIWDGSITSHPIFGETIKQAAKRRLKEEIGINDSSTLKKLFKFQYEALWENNGVEKEICAVFSLVYDGNIKPNPQEINGISWVSVKELEKDIKDFPKEYSPWLILALRRVDEKSKHTV